MPLPETRTGAVAEARALEPDVREEPRRPYEGIAWGLPRLGGLRGELVILAFFALAACLLTWPLVVTLHKASGMRGDYFNNLWNSWWLKHCLVNGESPYWTDYLYYPDGISLRRHTLSLLNAATMLGLGTFFDPHQSFALLLILHFTLSAWAFSFLARYVTGSTPGAVLAGLVYSFCPFHYFYLCQINIFSFEFLPLGLLFFLKHYREGGGRNLLGVGLCMAGMTLTVEYYVAYAYLALAVLLVCARGWAREVPLRVGLRRLALSTGLGALLAAVLAFPLLYAALGPERHQELVTSANPPERIRFNDLFGFLWLGGREMARVTWPVMMGYSTLVLLLVSWRRLLAHWPWLVLCAAFFVLSLGDELTVLGVHTGIPLPYALFDRLPVLSMLRKSDRFYMVVQLAVALLVAVSWGALAERVRYPGRRLALWGGCAALMMFELTAVPFGRFDLKGSPYFARLREDPDVKTVMELPAMPLHVANGRFDYFQTLHEKKSTLGFTTSLALSPVHDDRLVEIVNAHWQFINGENRELARLAVQLGVDRILHYRTNYAPRELDASIHEQTLWRPFFFWRRPLLYIRQVGEYVDYPYTDEQWAQVRLMFTRSFGAPTYEDEFMMAFDVPK